MRMFSHGQKARGRRRTTVAAAPELRTNGTAGTPAVIAAFLSTVRRVSVVFLIFPLY